ncbi:MAG TPA: aminodeoxychorismate/anthranilate synthase component II [Cellvibrio sp.]|nr:aminodeoxychorismate/anthranilate synthase component II [Cellvibrio sp.]
MKNILIVDNFDSFVYNVPQVISRYEKVKFTVIRNDSLEDKHFSVANFTHVILSPGPGNPTNADDFGRCLDVIDHYVGRRPILGICLGHQGIAAYYGATITTAQQIMHGRTSEIKLMADCPLFQDVESPVVMRYHSLVVEPGSLPERFKVTAVTNNEMQEIMAFNDEASGIYAVQFHPESVATLAGAAILNNFINLN